jgi:hypothetical protein
MFRLDYLSCVLTVVSTVLLGKRLWQGWVIAGANSIVVCMIGMKTAQFGLVPANLFCIGLYAHNLWKWRAQGLNGRPKVVRMSPGRTAVASSDSLNGYAQSERTLRIANAHQGD